MQAGGLSDRCLRVLLVVRNNTRSRSGSPSLVNHENLHGNISLCCISDS